MDHKMDYGVMAVTAYMWLSIFAKATVDSVSSMVCGFVMAQLFVDFMSGVTHWALDTWGGLATPILGTAFIRNFREHHIKPTAMTKHDFIKTNANSCFVIMPVLIATYFGYGHRWFTIFATVLTVMTNEFHKWAHTNPKHLPSLVVVLQEYRLILSPERHRKHHRAEHDRSYCITNGWMNPFLDNIEFWRKLESGITKMTGWIPRDDDSQWLSSSR